MYNNIRKVHSFLPLVDIFSRLYLKKNHILLAKYYIDTKVYAVNVFILLNTNFMIYNDMATVTYRQRQYYIIPFHKREHLCVTIHLNIVIIAQYIPSCFIVVDV